MLEGRISAQTSLCRGVALLSPASDTSLDSVSRVVFKRQLRGRSPHLYLRRQHRINGSASRCARVGYPRCNGRWSAWTVMVGRIISRLQAWMILIGKWPLFREGTQIGSGGLGWAMAMLVGTGVRVGSQSLTSRHWMCCCWRSLAVLTAQRALFTTEAGDPCIARAAPMRKSRPLAVVVGSRTAKVLRPYLDSTAARPRVSVLRSVRRSGTYHLKRGDGRCFEWFWARHHRRAIRRSGRYFEITDCGGRRRSNAIQKRSTS